MVGSSFILTRRHERRTLLNTAQIASIYTEDVDRATREGQVRYQDCDPAVTTLYTIQVLLTSRREFEYLFVSAVERDALFEQMQQAVSPSVTLDIAEPFVKRIPQPAKPAVEPSDYTTAELDRALTMALAQLKRDREQPPAPEEATPPAPKPPRKSRTKKGV